MTAIYSLPAGIGIREHSLNLIPRIGMSRMNNRRTDVVVFPMEAYFRSEFQTVYLTDAQIRTMEAWRLKLLEQDAVFECYDLFFPRPLAYGETPVSPETLAISSVITNKRAQVTVPSGFTLDLKEGDAIGIERTTLDKRFNRVAADVSVVGPSTATVDYLNDVDSTLDFTGAVMRLEKPVCLMRLNPDWSFARGYDGRQVSFSAEEATNLA